MPRTVTRREFIRRCRRDHGDRRARGAARPRQPRTRPNVLFILADDLGYGDLSGYGRPDYKTPVLDALREAGHQVHGRVRRGAGLHADALRVRHRPVSAASARRARGAAQGLVSADVGLPPNHPTVASLLKGNGYETALVGKWHLGWKPEFGPNRHGFDEFFGILSGAADYFTHRTSDGRNAAGGPGGSPDLWENLTPVERTGYLTDLLSDRAVEIIGRRRTKPFFLSLQYNAPHSPWEGPEDAAIDHADHGRGPMIEGGSPKIYASMMKSMDAGIGRVLKALERAKLERDTLVIFTSDNGGERVFVQLAVLVREDVPVRGRHARAGDRPLDGQDSRGSGDRAGRDHHGLDRDDSRRHGHRAGSGVSARRRESAARVHRPARRLRPRAVLAHHRFRRGARRAMEVPEGRGRRAPVRSLVGSWREGRPASGRTRTRSSV